MGDFEEHSFGRYRLLRKLGEGGMAEVFQAKSFGVEGFEKIVVIKRILPRLARHQDFVDMFVREAKVVVRLSHANVVQVFDLGRIDSPPEAPMYYMAMEYVAGMDLATLLERSRASGQKPPLGLAVHVAAEVAKGLDHAHRRRDERDQPLGIVHRDVSPQNILLSWEGEVKVADFGIAKARDSLEGATEDAQVRLIKGKYSYMSPEQARGDALDHRSDLFSLGTVMYEILTGANPFRAVAPTETLRRVREAEFPPLALVAPELPASLTELVARVMHPTAQGRFEDAARLHEALLSFSYRTGTRFGATDLAAFLQQLRDVAPPREQDRDAPTPPRGLAVPRAENDSAVIQLREVTLLCITARRTSGEPFDPLPPGLVERATAACERAGAVPLPPSDPAELLFLFGLTEADPRDAEQSVRAALAVRRACAEFPLLLGLGIQLGRVRVGDAGAPLLQGPDPLLLEARRLAAASRGFPLLSREAARQVRGLFVLHEQHDALRVEAARPEHEGYGKFFGRKAELAHLGTLLGAASKHQLRLVSLSGPAGIGKTRMLHEIDRRLQRGNFNVGVYVAPCSPRGKKTPISGVTSMLQVLCGVQEGDSAERIRSVEPSLRALGLQDDEVDAVLGQLGLPGVPPEGVATLQSAFLKTLLRLSEDRVHLFAWDNVQWLDEDSVAMLMRSLRRLATARIALVFSGRSALEALTSAPQHEPLQLGELSEEEALQLVGAQLGLREVPAALAEVCVQRAGGHPLFLEEILKDLLDAGAIKVEGGTVTRLDLGRAPSVPRPLRATMGGRVGRLPGHEQQLLQAAAVLGEVFDEGVLGGMVGLPEVADGLRSLEQRGLLRGASAGHLAFASPLLRDVVLDAIPAEHRRLLHGRAALALEQREAPLEQVAGQLQEAGLHHEAGLRWARSCKLREGQRRHAQATHDGLQALELLDVERCELLELLDLLKTIAAALDRVRLAPEAPRLLRSTLERLLPRATPTQELEARIEVCRALGALSRFQEAQQVLAEIAVEQLPGGLLQRLRMARAEIHFRRGDFRRFREEVEQLDDALIPEDAAVRSTLLRAQAHAVAARRDDALACLTRLPGGGGPAHEAQLEKLRGLAHFFAGDFVAAAASSTRGSELTRACGLTFETALHLHNLGDVLLHLDEHARAYAALQQSLSLCEQHHADRLAQQNRMYLGYLDARQGLPGGEALLREAIQRAEEQGYLWDLLGGRYLLGRLLEELGLPRAAAQEYERSLALSREAQNLLVEEESLQSLARLTPRREIVEE
jgi:serine/threonine protein kinase/tetratricopeptide (TPR) repeat protein